MNLSQLEVLIAIVETGNFTDAAELVGLTQSAVSYSLGKLEADGRPCRSPAEPGYSRRYFLGHKQQFGCGT